MFNVNKDKVVREYFDSMPIGEFLSILGAVEYRPKLYSLNYRDAEVQKMENKNYVLANFTDVVYVYLRKYNRMPTPHDYAMYEVKKVHSRLQRDKIQINDNVKKALYNRRVNSYVSFIAEIYTRMIFKRLLSSKYSILSSEEMDLVHGVDIVIKNNHTGKCAYIHVTSNTKYARDRALQKATKNGRDFTGHMWLYYDKKRIADYNNPLLPELSTDTTSEWNGYYLFKKDYIQEKIEYIEYKTNKQ